jgi:glycosidase
MYPSPQKDNGISNFKAIDPTFGTFKDFDKLVAGIHEHGLKLIMEIVPNHSSDQHEWFKRSAKREAPFTDYYVWRKGTRGTPPNNWVIWCSQNIMCQ